MTQQLNAFGLSRQEPPKTQEKWAAFLDGVERAMEELRIRMVSSAKFSALGEMAGEIAHEINNPLSILLFQMGRLKLELEREKVARSKSLEIIAVLEKMTTRISRIAMTIRSFARDDRAIPFEVASLRTVISETIELCQDRFTRNGVLLQVCSVSEELKLSCRAVQISQVLLNLLNNAHDAVSALDEKWVIVDVATAGDRLEISVTDSGKGIPIDLHGKVFQPFFTTKPDGRGTGLGLSISRSIVESHQGELRIDTRSPNTRFVVSFPATRVADPD